MRVLLGLWLVGACGTDPAPLVVGNCSSPLVVTFGEMGFSDGSVHPVAVGGREQLRPRCGTFGNELGGLDDYQLEVIDSDAMTVESTETVHDLVGLMPGDAKLRLTIHGQIFEDVPVISRAVDHIVLTPSGLVAGEPWAWATGRQYYSIVGVDALGVELRDHTQGSSFPTEQSDTSLVLDQVGEFTLQAHVGDLATNLPFSVVATADAIAAISAPSTLPANTYTSVCFRADNAGRAVLGLAWSYSIDGESQTETANCVSVDPDPGRATTTIEAAAGGQSAVLTLGVH